MKIFRIDYNVEPAPYWHYSDSSDRKGITEIKYVNGIYKVLDELHEKFPELIIDNCAGGGRRLDYEAGKRMIPIMCRSDYFTFKDYTPEGIQCHTYALSKWLPVSGDSAGSCSGQTNILFDTYKVRSSICSGIGIAAPAWELTEEEAAWYRKMLSDTYKVSPYLCKDYYPLTGYSLSLKDLLAYQFHDTDTCSGVIIAFRREMCPVRLCEFALRGNIEEESQYSLEDIDQGVIDTVYGKDLIHGYTFEIPEKRMCKIIFYNKIIM